MKLGIDISQIVYQGTGVARYTSGLINAILEHDTKNEWVFLFSSLRQKLNPQTKEKIIKRGFKLIELKIPPTLLSILWNNWHLLDLKKIVGNLDLFITSDWTEPPAKSIKKATIIHDLAFMRYPETIDKKILKTQKKRLEWVQKESSLIFADSQATKKDLIDFYKIDDKKIKVVYPGVDSLDTNKISTEQIIKKYSLTKPFILTVGKMEPRKNLKRLIKAFKQISSQDIDLVIVGPKGWEDFSNLAIEPRQTRLAQSNNIHFLGYIDDIDLFALYSSCMFFIYPSIWEGFGYPVVEAMKLGVAVAASNTSSLPELAQGAALLFDPMKVDEIKKAIEVMIGNKNLRNELGNKGKEVSKIFSWENGYKTMIGEINKIL